MINLDLGSTRLIIDEARRHGLTDNQTAYVLATAYWETNRTMQPVEEAYYLGARAEAYRQKLRYHPWHGRGFVQLTWERNYILAGQKIGVDLITDPDSAMEPHNAAKILVIGSAEGWFTRKKLSDYISSQKCDYVNARRIINGTDKAAQIADVALEYEHAITPEPEYIAIRRGSVGASVVAAQELLAALGYAIAVDGKFGSNTEASVKAFQRSNGLVPDGIIGPRTWAELLPDDL